MSFHMIPIACKSLVVLYNCYSIYNSSGPTIQTISSDEALQNKMDVILECMVDTVDAGTILSLMFTSKRTANLIACCLKGNPRLFGIFSNRIYELEKETASLKKYYLMEKEFNRLRSPKRFVGEMISFLPIVGEFGADCLGYQIHIPSAGELFDNYADTHHFVDAKAKILEEYANGTKIDHLETICNPDTCYQVSSKSHELSSLSHGQIIEFIMNSGNGIGIFIAKIALVKAVPIASLVFTAKKIYEAKVCYDEMVEFRKQGLTQRERVTAMLFQRVLRLLSNNQVLRRSIVDSTHADYRAWMINFSLMSFPKKHE